MSYSALVSRPYLVVEEVQALLWYMILWRMLKRLSQSTAWPEWVGKINVQSKSGVKYISTILWENWPEVIRNLHAWFYPLCILGYIFFLNQSSIKPHLSIQVLHWNLEIQSQEKILHGKLYRCSERIALKTNVNERCICAIGERKISFKNSY